MQSNPICVNKINFKAELKVKLIDFKNANVYLHCKSFFISLSFFEGWHVFLLKFIFNTKEWEWKCQFGPRYCLEDELNIIFRNNLQVIIWPFFEINKSVEELFTTKTLIFFFYLFFFFLAVVVVGLFDASFLVW